MKFIPKCKDTDHWKTPDYLKEAITEQVVHFYSLYDPCPSEPAEDGLLTVWPKDSYVNCPYSVGLQKLWVLAAEKNSVINKHLTYYLLLPLDCTEVFGMLYKLCHQIWMPDKRIKFVGAKNCFNKPVALYVMNWWAKKYRPGPPILKILEV